MRDSVKFLLGNEVKELREVDPNMTVLEYLRLEEHLTGTKEGCAEGDCGACTVAVGTLNGDTVSYQSINACIKFLPTLDGKQLLTVEHLKSASGALHPVQQAMVDTHGSQCGFCTPGFVMSMFVLGEEGGEVSRPRIDDALAGNLCRCTGYGAIIEAAEIVAPAPSVAGPETVAALKALQSDETLSLDGPSGQYFAPRTTGELASLLSKHEDATILAGATDVGLWVTKQHRRLSPIIYIGDVAELAEIKKTDSVLEIGAAVTYSDVHAAIADLYLDFGELVRRIGSRQIRNAGTIGGNIANGSPIGDSPPALIALGARLVLRSASGVRELPLEDFFIEYGKQDRRPDEFVEKVILPLTSDGDFRCYKISKRFDQDITASLGAFNLTIRDGKVADARICFGGMAGTPQRATASETALIGKEWSRQTVEAGCAALEQDFTPLSDMRASAEYRMKVAKNLLRKYYVETTAGDTATRLVGEGALVHG